MRSGRGDPNRSRNGECIHGPLPDRPDGWGLPHPEEEFAMRQPGDLIYSFVTGLLLGLLLGALITIALAAAFH
jgi:hypothetical protein